MGFKNPVTSAQAGYGPITVQNTVTDVRRILLQQILKPHEHFYSPFSGRCFPMQCSQIKSSKPLYRGSHRYVP